ncbi:MAG TPA: hypothetical protein VEB20_10025 [Azospirillaceae bacterium]|nr:hypothetical protein [Azospirillaceae bacterium]
MAELRSIPLDNMEAINSAIRNRETFKVVGCGGRMSKAVQLTERAIESQGLKCRVYTAGRKAALAGIAIPTGITQAIGLISAAGMAAHNIATYAPDYEISKHKIDNYLTVEYKKG